MKAYEAVYADLGGMDVAALLSSGEVSQNMNFAVNKLQGDSTYDGVGVRVSYNKNIPGQTMDFTITPFYESADIATIQLGLNGTKFYAGSLELTSNKFYGVDTVTLGKDIANLVDDDYMENLSFNVYDLNNALKEAQNADAIKKSIKEANKVLVESLEIEKLEQETIKVNNEDVKATKYHVVLTTKALDDYLDAVEKSIDAKQIVNNTNAVIESLGLSEDMEDELKAECESRIDLSDLFDELHDIVDEMEDIEVDAYVGNGYLVAVEYEGDFENSKITARAQLGGGKNYVDDITVSFKVKGEGELVLTSTGNHCGEGGVFTDETTITFKENGGSRETIFAAESEYNKKDLSYEGKIEVGDESTISFEGTWKMDKSSLDIQLSKLKVKSWGESVFEGSVGYAVGPYKSTGTNVTDVAMLLTMSEDELMELGEDIADNAEALMEDLNLDFYLPFYTFDDMWGYGDDSSDAGYSTDYIDDSEMYSIGYDDGYTAGLYGWEYDTSSSIYINGSYVEYMSGYDVGYSDGYSGCSYGLRYGASSYYWY